METNEKLLSLDDIYFKDCFTEVDAGINAEFNKATIKCFNSTNNAFSMDCEGNLVVNSITTKESNSSLTNIDFEKIYPIGSIYLSTNNINPKDLFGGVWEQIEDKFLLSSGKKYKTNEVGGSETHSMTIDELVNHVHRTYLSIGNSVTVPEWKIRYDYKQGGNTEVGGLGEVEATGNGQPFSIMPPYIVVNVWKRVA